MLPYSPLHHLLLADSGVPLVMTSGNVTDEPIAFRDDDALRAARPGSPTCSSSTTVRSRPAPTTRSSRVLVGADAAADRCAARAATSRPRCRCPSPRPRPVLAVRRRAEEHVLPRQGRRAWVGHHIGDLDELRDARARSREGIEHFERLFAVRPAGRRARPASRVPVDASYALGARGRAARRGAAPPRAPGRVPRRARPDGPAVGAIFDGTGLGTDGTVWGGELLLGDLAGFERDGHAVAGAPAGRRRRRSGSPGGWRRLARRGGRPATRSPGVAGRRRRPGALAAGRPADAHRVSLRR